MPNNSPTNLQRIPSQFDITLDSPRDNAYVAAPPPSSSNSSSALPPKLAGWYSTKVFRTTCFFIFCFCVLGISTALVFDGRMSIENFMNVLSSLLFLLSPSPLDLIKNTGNVMDSPPGPRS